MREDLSDDKSQKAGLAFNHQTRAPRYSSAARMAFLTEDGLRNRSLRSTFHQRTSLFGLDVNHAH